MSELVLDPRYEILDIIDKESHKYNHIQQYVKWDDSGQVAGCCINGLVMMHLGWKPDKAEWWTTYHRLPDSWQEAALKMKERYGPDALGDINAVNSSCNGWADAKQQLKEYWHLP